MRTAKVAIFLVGIGVASTGQANASQPISVSMAECAAIAFVSAERVETPSRKTYILGVADTWLEAEHSEAGQDMTNIARLWHATGRLSSPSGANGWDLAFPSPPKRTIWLGNKGC